MLIIQCKSGGIIFAVRPHIIRYGLMGWISQSLVEILCGYGIQMPCVIPGHLPIEHTVERFGHFSEHCQVSRLGNNVIVENAGKRVTLSTTDEIETGENYGNEELPAGWVSRRFDVKVPCATLVWKSRISSMTVLTAEIDCSAI